MRCLTTTILMTPTPAPITQEVLSTINLLIVALGQVQAGPVGLPHRHLQVTQPPLQEAVLWFILMAAVQRMAGMVLGLELVFIGVQKTPGMFCLF